MKRFRPSREVIFLAALLLLLAGFGAFVALRQEQLNQAQQVFTPYSSHSSRDHGTLALYEWANALGYRAQRIENTAFGINDDTRLLFVFAPRIALEPDQTRQVLQWVERGNTLVVADSGGLLTNGLYHALKIETTALPSSAAQNALSQPAADADIQALNGESYRGLETRREDVVPFMETEKPLMLRVTRGQGVIWILAAPALLNNENLRNPNNAKFARALLASARPAAALRSTNIISA